MLWGIQFLFLVRQLFFNQGDFDILLYCAGLTFVSFCFASFLLRHFLYLIVKYLWFIISETFTGFVGLSQCREHFLFIMVCVSLMDGLTENKAWRKAPADVHLRLKESQPFRGMMCILILNKNVSVVFTFPSCSWILSWSDVCFRSSWY